jgi:hypothetical protein
MRIASLQQHQAAATLTKCKAEGGASQVGQALGFADFVQVA